MFINSGGGTAANLNEFDLYRFQVSAFSPNAANAPNTPAPTVLFSDDLDPRDAHGAVLTKLQRYLWVGDQGSNVAEVFDVVSGSRVNTVVLSGTGADDPTPDLIDLAPSGNRLFFSLRGPNPLTGDPHVATGSTPGLGVYQVEANGADGRLKGCCADLECRWWWNRACRRPREPRTTKVTRRRWVRPRARASATAPRPAGSNDARARTDETGPVAVP